MNMIVAWFKLEHCFNNPAKQARGKIQQQTLHEESPGNVVGLQIAVEQCDHIVYSN